MSKNILLLSDLPGLQDKLDLIVSTLNVDTQNSALNAFMLERVPTAEGEDAWDMYEGVDVYALVDIFYKIIAKVLDLIDDISDIKDRLDALEA